jgi:glycosyltransferase involved in cell wall biosynthesis
MVTSAMSSFPPPPNLRVLRIISNVPRLDRFRTARFLVAQEFAGRSKTWRDGIKVFIQSFGRDLIILDAAAPCLFMLCLLRWLFPFQRCKLVSLDQAFQAPVNWKQRWGVRLKRLLLRKVDRFILHFIDYEGYERFYGINPSRWSYVPFKVNSWEQLPPLAQLSADGEYVLCAGRSRRDLGTLAAAMRHVDHPGLLLHQKPSVLRSHGSDPDLGDLPNNLQAIEDDGNNENWLDYIQRAKVVVIPILPNTISPAGISTYILAMALRKCVIITEGPSTRGLLSDQAILVPPNDPASLADAINRVWNDTELRTRIADSGRRYAEQLGGYDRLLSEVVDVCGRLVMGAN